MEEAAVAILRGHAAVSDIPFDQARRMTSGRREYTVRENHVDRTIMIDPISELLARLRHVPLNHDVEDPLREIRAQGGLRVRTGNVVVVRLSERRRNVAAAKVYSVVNPVRPLQGQSWPYGIHIVANKGGPVKPAAVGPGRDGPNLLSGPDGHQPQDGTGNQRLKFRSTHCSPCSQLRLMRMAAREYCLRLRASRIEWCWRADSAITRRPVKKRYS